MKRVVITRHETMTAPYPYKGATPENAVASLAAKRGLLFRPSFHLTLNDLLPPWRIDDNSPEHGDLTIWQGDVKCPTAATTTATTTATKEGTAP